MPSPEEIQRKHIERKKNRTKAARKSYFKLVFSWRDKLKTTEDAPLSEGELGARMRNGV